MRPPYFQIEKTVKVYTSLDRQLERLFVDISFTKIGKLRSVQVCDKLEKNGFKV